MSLYFDPIFNMPRQRGTLPYWSKVKHYFDPRALGTLTRTTMANFSGSNYLTCPDSASMAISNGKFSVAWKANRRKVYPANGSFQGRPWLGQRNPTQAGGGGWIAYEGPGASDNNELHIAFSTNSTGSTGFEVGTAINVTSGNFRDNWTSYGITVDLAGSDHTTKVKFYRDGVLVSTTHYSSSATLASTTSMQASTCPFVIGAGIADNAAYAYQNGGMREIQYAPGVAWSADDHLAFHNGTPGPSLAIRLKCDETSGTRYDSSGNGNHFTEVGGTVGAIYPVLAWRCSKTGKEFAFVEGKCPVWEAAGWRGYPCVRAHNEIYGELRAAHSNFYRTSGVNDIFDACAWGSIITSSEAGIFGVTQTADASTYMFTGSSRVTHADGVDIADKTVPGLRYRDEDDSPNDHVYMNVTGLSADQEFTSHWRLLKSGTGLNRFAAEFDGATATVARQSAAAGDPGSPNTFGEIPTNGNDTQGLFCYPTGTLFQGSNGKLCIAGLAMYDGLTDSEAAAVSDFWESRMA